MGKINTISARKPIFIGFLVLMFVYCRDNILFYPTNRY